MPRKAKVSPVLPVSAGATPYTVRATKDGYYDNTYRMADGPTGPSVFVYLHPDGGKWPSWMESLDGPAPESAPSFLGLDEVPPVE